MRKFGPLLLLLFLGGCSAGYYGQGVKLGMKGMHQEAVGLFYQEIKEQPDNEAAWRELGIEFYHLEDYARAEEALAQATRIKPDARAQLYLGLIYEQSEDYDRALTAYRQAVKLQPDHRTEKVIRSHIRSLVEKRLKKEIDQAMANEANLETAQIPRNSIAVVNFDVSGLPVDLAPLGRGLVEFTSLDLAKVHALEVVERGKIGLLLDELNLSRSGLSDPETRLRVGRLVGSRHLVTGSMGLAGKDELEIYGAIGNTLNASVVHPKPAVGSLAKFFALEKNLVFGIIDSLGITLSLQERDAIQEVPTESFLAFMAYCRGLDAEADGDLGAAVGYFGQAAAADPGFTQAQSQNEDVKDALEFSDTATPESFEDAVVSSVVETFEKQTYLIMLAESSQFLPSDIPDVGLNNATPNLPDMGTSGGVSIIIRGRIDDSR